jgi:hypothetical protein
MRTARTGDRHKSKADRHRFGSPDRHKPRTGDRHRADNPLRMAQPFLAVDGEGWGRDELGRQYYQLMIAANDRETYVLDTGRPLRTHDCLEWLWSLPTDRVLVGFSFGYDTSMILRDLPFSQLAELHRREDRMDPETGTPRLVNWESWGLDVMPRKELTVIDWSESKRRTVVHDVFAFFGEAYLEVLKAWNVATPEELELIRAGKARREGAAPREEPRNRGRVKDRFNLRDIEQAAGEALNTLDRLRRLADIPLRKTYRDRDGLERFAAPYGLPEWEWSHSISRAERNRLHSKFYTAPGGMAPDAFLEDLAAVTGRGDLFEWLRLTRVADAWPYARRGRELPGSFGGVRLEDLFEPAEEWRDDTPDDPEHDRELEASYSILECKTLCRIMDRLRRLCKGVGYPLTSYYGAGSVASSMLRIEKVKNHIAEPPAKMRGPVTRAYFGGRFETAQLGPVGAVHYSDINSAYPAEIAKLPCLACGKWREAQEAEIEVLSCGDAFPDDWSLWRVRWDGWFDHWGPLPYRSKHQSITFPMNGLGWYWGAEVRAALAYCRTIPGAELELEAGWVFEPGCDHEPFAFVRDVYAERQRLKAVPGDHSNIVLKLGLNSLYGKTAQTVGKPAYASMVWAGMTTAGTRAKILGAITEAPETVVAVATDSVTSTAPLHLPISPALGDWDYETVEDLFIAGDGLSHAPDNRKRTRSRGAHPDEMVWPKIREEWDRHGINGKVTFQIVRFHGIAIATVRNRDDLCGKWLTEDRTLKFASSGKRTTEWGGYTPVRTREPVPLSAIYHKLDTLEMQEIEAIHTDDPDAGDGRIG